MLQGETSGEANTEAAIIRKNRETLNAGVHKGQPGYLVVLPQGLAVIGRRCKFRFCSCGEEELAIVGIVPIQA